MPSETLSRPQSTSIQDTIDAAQSALRGRQSADGHWLFELEADATIPAEYILLEHYLDRIDPDLQALMAVYLRGIQGAHGGWPLFYDGPADLSASVKAYFALKAAGDSADQPHMIRARERILAMGGAERTNVFTRIQLALFGQVPWRATPVMPVEIMHLPRWFFFHLSKVSYWSRTVMVPLLVLMALRPRARNKRGASISELFHTPPEEIRSWIHGPYRSAWGIVFKTLDTVLRPIVPHFPAAAHKRALEAAVAFTVERLNGDDGLGAIYPAMANSVMMFDALGYAPDHPHAATMPVPDLGHGTRRSRHRGGRGAALRLDRRRVRLAGRAADHRPEGRLGLAPPGRAPGWLGVPVRQRALSGRRRHRRRRHAAAPGG
jgi:squalene-hopene/tetraprenyl-beta-curcumene cyclase